MLLIDDKAIFVHVPRTGGMFTRKVIDSTDLDHEQIYYTHGSIGETHKSVDIDTSNYYSFGFIRNPWKWTVSIFLQFGGFPHNADVPAQVFERELNNYIGDKSLQSRYYKQFYINNKLSVTDIFKTENLEESLNYVFDKFNWEKPKELIEMTPINTRLHNSHNSHRKYYTDYTKELIYNHNRDIIEKYNYSF